MDTGGLGDGEGAQDVSNQIETEDQVRDFNVYRFVDFF